MLFRIFSLSILCFIATTAITQAAVTPDAATNFISTWNTENSGTSGNNEITIPGTGAGYSYEIYWEDTASSSINGTTTLITANSYTLTFPAAGIYEVQASGTIPRIYFNNAGDKDKILTIEQWGDNAWTSMDYAFRGATNLRIPATDAPDLSNVTILRGMFQYAESLNDPLDHWDVSNVTSLNSMFSEAISFNQPLNNWDVSSVTFMGAMFAKTKYFNQNLNSWNTSNVTSVYKMFQFAEAFNGSINDWDVSQITTFEFMFHGAESFNQPLDQWDTSNATRLFFMFGLTDVFNQDISMWDTSNVTDVDKMFILAKAFNQNLEDWDVSKVTTFRQMFQLAESYNQPLNNWQLSSTSDIIMNEMFCGARSFNQPLDQWDVSRVTTMDEMFESVSVYNDANNLWEICSLTGIYGVPDEPLRAPALSTTNQNATLVSWAAQSVQSNVPFNLGQKTYTATGAAAIETLRNTYGWTITEEYQAEYIGTSDALVEGSAIQTNIASGDSSTAVTINPDKNCEFLQWSDGNTDNPRTDTMTDNVTVTAELRCVTYSTSAATQKKRSADKEDELEINNTTTTTTPATTEPTTPFVPPATLDESLELVKEIDLTGLDPVTDKEAITKLIDVLLELIQALTLLMMGVKESD